MPIAGKAVDLSRKGMSGAFHRLTYYYVKMYVLIHSVNYENYVVVRWNWHVVHYVIKSTTLR